jgi:hypothetical protein
MAHRRSDLANMASDLRLCWWTILGLKPVTYTVSIYLPTLYDLFCKTFGHVKRHGAGTLTTTRHEVCGHVGHTGCVPAAMIVGIWLSGWEDPGPYMMQGAHVVTLPFGEKAGGLLRAWLAVRGRLVARIQGSDHGAIWVRIEVGGAAGTVHAGGSRGMPVTAQSLYRSWLRATEAATRDDDLAVPHRLGVFARA